MALRGNNKHIPSPSKQQHMNEGQEGVMVWCGRGCGVEGGVVWEGKEE